MHSLGGGHPIKTDPREEDRHINRPKWCKMFTAEEMHSVEEVVTVENGSKAVWGVARGRRGRAAGDRLRLSQRGRRRLTVEQRVSRGRLRSTPPSFLTLLHCLHSSVSTS